jgi:hypothetical protein
MEIKKEGIQKKGRTQFTNLDYLLGFQKCLQLLVEALPL